MQTQCINEVLAILADSRRVFHSEADFQQVPPASSPIPIRAAHQVDN